MFRTSRQRPTKLTNRNCCYSGQDLADILRKKDIDLGWSDFMAIFSWQCVGTFEEKLYFVPIAFAHLRQNPHDGFEYLYRFIDFFSTNADALTANDLLEPARDALVAMLDSWTATFEVVHYDAAACAAKGWRHAYSDIVDRAQIVCESMDLLVERPALEEVVERFVGGLAASTAEVRTAWFLEIARALQAGEVDPIGKSPSTVTRTRVQDLLTDPIVLNQKFEAIRDSLIPSTPSPTYWRDTAWTLGIERPTPNA